MSNLGCLPTTLQDRHHFPGPSQAAECHRWAHAHGDRPVCWDCECILSAWRWSCCFSRDCDVFLPHQLSLFFSGVLSKYQNSWMACFSYFFEEQRERWPILAATMMFCWVEQTVDKTWEAVGLRYMPSLYIFFASQQMIEFKVLGVTYWVPYQRFRYPRHHQSMHIHHILTGVVMILHDAWFESSKKII